MTSGVPDPFIRVEKASSYHTFTSLLPVSHKGGGWSTILGVLLQSHMASTAGLLLGKERSEQQSVLATGTERLQRYSTDVLCCWRQ